MDAGALSSRGNSDWTEDLPPVPGVSAFTTCHIKYCTFSWKFEAIEICGFFTTDNNKQKTEFRQKIASKCFEIQEHTNGEKVQKYLYNLLDELRTSRISSPTSCQPPQFGIVIRHGAYAYTGLFGCQMAMWPILEKSTFATTISVDIHPIPSNRNMNFILLVSNGLLQYLEAACCPRPISRIVDEFRETLHQCTDGGDDQLSMWTVDRLKNSYGSFNKYDVLLVSVRLPQPSFIEPLSLSIPEDCFPTPTIPTVLQPNSVSNSFSTVSSAEEQIPFESAPTISPVKFHTPSSHPKLRNDDILPSNAKEVPPYVDGFEYFSQKFAERHPRTQSIQDLNIRINETL